MFHQEAPAVEPAVPVHVAYTPTFWGAHGQDRIWGVRADMESAVERFEWVDAIEGGSPELVVVWRRSGTLDHVDDCEETTGTMSELGGRWRPRVARRLRIDRRPDDATVRSGHRLRARRGLSRPTVCHDRGEHGRGPGARG